MVLKVEWTLYCSLGTSVPSYESGKPTAMQTVKCTSLMNVPMTTIQSIDAARTAYRRYAVIGLYVLSAFWGVAQLLEPANSILDVTSTIAFASCATLWFTIDRRILGKPQIPVLRLLFLLTWPAGSLVHLLTSRGLRGVGYWFLHAVGMFLTTCLTFFPAMFLLSWMGVVDLDTISAH